jgi:predicted dehydrogenase
MRVVIVGCGRAGEKRARALGGTGRLVGVADSEAGRAEALAAGFPGCAVETDWRRLLAREDFELAIVATPHDLLAEVAAAAAERGRHVLVEKPAARSVQELDTLIGAARKAGVSVGVGFNHRFHPALREAHALFSSGAIGALLSVRARYGHGGRPGYEREWRADPDAAGGGELIDQGVHLIDLARWFAGEFVDAGGHLARLYWPARVEDNAFLLLTTAAGQVAWLHASWTEWKNLFCFEVFGREGKLQVDGLGGSYGVERLTVHRLGPAPGPPDTSTREYPGEDPSWREELADLVGRIEAGRPPAVGLEDARAALEIVGKLYAHGSAGAAPPAGVPVGARTPGNGR